MGIILKRDTKPKCIQKTLTFEIFFFFRKRNTQKWSRLVGDKHSMRNESKTFMSTCSAGWLTKEKRLCLAHRQRMQDIRCQGRHSNNHLQLPNGRQTQRRTGDRRIASEDKRGENLIAASHFNSFFNRYLTIPGT